MKYRVGKPYEIRAEDSEKLYLLKGGQYGRVKYGISTDERAEKPD